MRKAKLCGARQRRIRRRRLLSSLGLNKKRRPTSRAISGSGEKIQLNDIFEQSDPVDPHTLNWDSFDEFDLHCLRQFCEDQHIQVPALPQAVGTSDGGHTASYEPIDEVRKHYLATIYKNLTNDELNSPTSPTNNNSSDITEDDNDQSDNEGATEEETLQTTEWDTPSSNTRSKRRIQQSVNELLWQPRKKQRTTSGSGHSKVHSSNGVSENSQPEKSSVAGTRDHQIDMTAKKNVAHAEQNKKRRLTPSQREAWQYIGVWERHELECLMDGHWSWKYSCKKRIKSPPSLFLLAAY